MKLLGSSPTSVTVHSYCVHAGLAGSLIPGTMMIASPLEDKSPAFGEATANVKPSQEVSEPKVEVVTKTVAEPKVEIKANVAVVVDGPADAKGEDFPSEDFPASSDAAHTEVGHDETGLFNPPAKDVPLGTQESHPGE